MRAEGRVAIVVVLVIVVSAGIYFFRSGSEESIDLTTPKDIIKKVEQKTENMQMPLAPPKIITEGPEEKTPDTQPVINEITITETTEEKQKPAKITLDLLPEPTKPITTLPAETQVKPNQPASVKLEFDTIKPEVKPEDEKVHIVRPGDTLYGIAEKYYGRGELWTVIQRSNPKINPDRLLVGQKIIIPPSEDAAWKFEGPKDLPEDVDKANLKSYKVKSGESFYTIARDQLGDASRWKELFRINKSSVKGNPKNLRVGQKIFIPK